MNTKFLVGRHHSLTHSLTAWRAQQESGVKISRVLHPSGSRCYSIIVGLHTIRIYHTNHNTSSHTERKALRILFSKRSNEEQLREKQQHSPSQVRDNSHITACTIIPNTVLRSDEEQLREKQQSDIRQARDNRIQYCLHKTKIKKHKRAEISWTRPH